MAYETLTFRPSKENKTILAQLAKLAKQDNRNLNNYIETILLAHIQAGVSKSFCECEHEYGHKWNKKGDRLICVECEKYV